MSHTTLTNPGHPFHALTATVYVKVAEVTVTFKNVQIYILIYKSLFMLK